VPSTVVPGSGAPSSTDAGLPCPAAPTSFSFVPATTTAPAPPPSTHSVQAPRSGCPYVKPNAQAPPPIIWPPSTAHLQTSASTSGSRVPVVQCMCQAQGQTFPSIADLIHCVECRTWQHVVCVGLQLSPPQQRLEYLCNECRVKLADPFWKTAEPAGWVVPLQHMLVCQVSFLFF
jgi:hypothetical protein